MSIKATFRAQCAVPVIVLFVIHNWNTSTDLVKPDSAARSKLIDIPHPSVCAEDREKEQNDSGAHPQHHRTSTMNM
jgi:hypothetical protein